MKLHSFFLFVFLFSSVALSESYRYEYESGEDPDFNAGFYLGLSGNYSNPVRLSSDSYEPGPGFGGRVGFNTNGLKGFLGMSVFLAMDKNSMGLKDNSVRADIYDAYLGMEAILFSVKYGIGFGGLKFSLPSSTFNELGGTTLTELKHENDDIQMCQSFWTGVRVPIPVENDFWNRWSLDYEYRMLSADRAWMFWHDLFSSAIVGISYDIVVNISDALDKKDMEVTATILRFAAVGLVAGYWYLDYEYHNWPWRDESPFRMHRHGFCLNFQFKRLDLN